MIKSGYKSLSYSHIDVKIASIQINFFTMSLVWGIILVLILYKNKCGEIFKFHFKSPKMEYILTVEKKGHIMVRLEIEEIKRRETVKKRHKSVRKRKSRKKN